MGAWIVAIAAASGSVLANEGKPSKGGGGSSGGAAPQPGGGSAEGGRPMGGEGAHSASEEGEGPDEPGPVRVGVDLVIGTGQTTIANTTPPTAVEAAPANSLGSSQVTVESLIFGASVEFGHFEVGVRLPVTFGSFNPPDAPSRATAALGNVELEGLYAHHLRPNLELRYSLGIALPTAQGQEVPAHASDLVTNSSGVIDQSSYDRGALNRAAASARGWEDNALFEPSRFGIIPKVELAYELRSLVLEPYVKLENLIDTSGKADHSYVAELVIGARAAYRLTSHVEPGVRIWTNLGGELNGISDDKPVAVVEPEVRFPFRNVTGIVGGILPFAGPLTSPYFVGVRVGAVARF
jgi:hypothetical protein